MLESQFYSKWEYIARSITFFGSLPKVNGVYSDLREHPSYKFVGTQLVVFV